jgi:hypothetical protein
MLTSALLSIMAFVEQETRKDYPNLRWGKEICVKVNSDELEVSGSVYLQGGAETDALYAYRRAVSRFGGPKRQGKISPHIRFANACSDRLLVKFVQEYGPVVACSLHDEEREISSDGPDGFRDTLTVLVARQSLPELRRERVAYSSALALVSELQRGKQANISVIRQRVSDIIETVSLWPEQWEREQQMRASGQGYADQPTWRFQQDELRKIRLWGSYVNREPSGDPIRDVLVGIDPIRAAHNVVCELVNAFSPHVYLWGNAPAEAPDTDLTCGIRPVLYYILRREYLKGSGISICRNTECRELFEIERFGQEFCGDVCSRLHRQREYWKTAGKKLRKRRLKTIKSVRSRLKKEE